MHNISQRTKKVRLALGMSQVDFAKRMDFSRNYISLVERGGAQNPSPRFLRELEALEKASAMTTIVREERHDYSMPPHVLPRTTQPGPSSRPKTPHENYAEAVAIMGDLLEEKPESLESLMVMLRALHQTLEKK